MWDLKKIKTFFLHIYLSISIRKYTFWNFKATSRLSSGQIVILAWEKKEEKKKEKEKASRVLSIWYLYEYLTQALVAIIVVHCIGLHFFGTTRDVQYLSMKRGITTGVSNGAALIFRRGVSGVLFQRFSCSFLKRRCVLKNGTIQTTGYWLCGYLIPHLVI